MKEKKLRVLISGVGTGGHIFPAVSIANEIKHSRPDAEILFVGAESRMEMEKVPAAGYKIIGLPVYGFDRRNLLRNFKVLYNLFKSIAKARKIVKEFAPVVEQVSIDECFADFSGTHRIYPDPIALAVGYSSME